MSRYTLQSSKSTCPELDGSYHATERSFCLVHEHDRLVSILDVTRKRPTVLTTSCYQYADEKTDRSNRCKAEHCVVRQAMLKRLAVDTSSTSSGLRWAGMSMSNHHYCCVRVCSVACLLPGMISNGKAAGHILLISCLRVTG